MGKSLIKKSDLIRYKGAIHIHTIFSDGTGDVETITKAAKKAGLAWIIITDHNAIGIREGIYNDVYVIVGEEISPKNGNHYLALDIDKLIEPDDDPQVYVNSVREQNGFGFAAHPNEGIERKNQTPPLPWANKEIIPDGVEIWNWFSNWGNNYNDRNLYTIAHSFLHRHRLVSNPLSVDIDWWDELNNKYEKIVPAIGGVDAHALKISKYLLPVTVFPYKTCFETITNTIYLKETLSENFDIAKKQILDAIKHGNNLIINRKICKDIPDIVISNQEKAAGIGEEIALAENTYLNITSKNRINIRIIYEGKCILEENHKNFQFPITKKGKYRVECFRSKRGFAYSNPIRVI